MLQYTIIAPVLLFLVNLSLAKEYPTVETSLGTVRGHYKLSYGGRKYAAFEGIPYAKPPTGDLRFEPPVEVEAWCGIWNATVGRTCPQLDWQSGEPIGNEDCLHLNVYVPKNRLKNTENLNVIVHIHGGSFVVGSGEFAGPEYLMDRNVVYVSMNYRLGALGFLSTEDDVVPGNMGLKDQVMALRWIQNHIRNFGGNPNSVTITGWSSGAASVHLHYLSPLSKGLFHRGISHGGTALMPGAILKDPLKRTLQLAASVGCDNLSTKEMVKCLKQRTVIQLHNSDNELSTKLFSPVVEKNFQSAFIADHPYNLLKSGNFTDLPWIAGSTTEEGIIGLEILQYQYDDLNKNWNENLPYLLGYDDAVAESDKITVGQKIKDFYLNGNNVTEDNIQSFIKLLSDRLFLLALENSARLQVKVAKSSIYCYIYGYVQNANCNEPSGTIRNYGVGHGRDINLLYTNKFSSVCLSKKGKLSESDEKIKELFLDFVTSFTKDGKPVSHTVTWYPLDNSGDFRYLLFKNRETKTVSKSELVPREFWKSLPLKEYENME